MKINTKLIGRCLLALSVFSVLMLLPDVARSQVVATGGTMYETNNFTFYVFTNVGNTAFEVETGGDVDVFIVAGGGGGRNGGSLGLGGGGAGGVILTNVTLLSDTNYTITVGDGGVNRPGPATHGDSGSNSVAFGFVAFGGGGGARGGYDGLPGGSGGGGGAGWVNNYDPGSGGAGTNDQGRAGGSGSIDGSNGAGGGGGGYSTPGSNAVVQAGGRGGEGINMSAWLQGLSLGDDGWFAGGGGGGSRTQSGPFGGKGGGGRGAGSNTAGQPGLPNTGGGGGGGGGGSNQEAAPGGSGIVVIRDELPIGVLDVRSSPATGVGGTNATLNGWIREFGSGGSPDIYFCFGTADGGNADTSSWQRVIALGDNWEKEDSFSHTLFDLDFGEDYYYRVYAIDSDENENWSGLIEFSTFVFPSVTNDGLLWTARRQASVKGTLTDDGDNPSLVWGEYWPTDAGTPTSTVEIATLTSVTAFDALLDNLDPATGYTFRFAASNTAGIAYSGEDSLTTHSADPMAWYVATNGNHTAGTNWVTAWTNLQHALSVAEEDDTICLAGETFELTAALTWTGVNDLKIRGGYEADPEGALPGNRDSDQWPTVIRQMTSGQRVLTISSINGGLLEQVTITGGRNVSEGGGIRMQAASGIVMTDCRIIDNLSRASGAAGGGIWINNTSSLAMTNCVVRGNSAHATGGNAQSNGGGIFNAGTLRMVDCVLAENNNSRNADGWERGGAIYSSGTVTLDNCLLYGNTARWQGDGVYKFAGTLRMINCTVAHNGKQGVYRNGGTVSATNSIFWGHVNDFVGTVSLSYCNTESGEQVGENGNISADPLFEFGYYLGDVSPARDAGTGSSRLTAAPFTTWFDGTPDAGAVDMGYHYQTAADTSHANLYVAENGDDLNAGTDLDFPLRSLTAALAKAKPGTHIQVGAGVYTNGIETMPIQVVNLNGVTIEGAGEGETVFHGLDQEPLVMSVYQVQNTVISDISITGGYVASSNAEGCGLYIGSANVEFLRCAVTNNYMHSQPSKGSGVFVDIGSYARLTDSLVADNRISTGGSGWGCYGAGIFNQGYLVVRDSLLLDNNNAVSASVGNDYGGALYNTLGTAILRNCLIAGNTATDRGDGIYSASSGYSNSGNVILENCTVADNGSEGLYQFGSGTITATNTIIWGHASDIVGTVTLSHCNTSSGEQAGENGNISDNPLFEFGYYLGEGSPSRDAGTGGEWLLDGNYTTRITGEPDTAPVDMGYHYFTTGGRI